MANLWRVIGRAAALLDQYHWVVMLVAAPWLLFPAPSRTLALAVVPGLWIIAGLAGRQPVPRTPLNAVLLLLSLMVLVSLYATPDLAFSLPKVAGVLLGIAGYYAFVRWSENPAMLRRAVQVCALAGGGLSAVGLLGTNWVAKSSAFDRLLAHMPRVIIGLPGAQEGFSANAVAGVLTLFIPLQAMLFLEAARPTVDVGPRRARRFLWVGVYGFLLMLTGGTLLLAQSRGAWLGMALGLAALLAWHSGRSRLLLAAILVVSTVLVAIVGPQKVLELAGRGFGSGIGQDIASRLEVWSRALFGIQDFPLTGMGMTMFRRVLPVLYPTFLLPAGFDVADAHNQFLQAALDLGLPGLVAYLALWLGAAYMLIMAYWRARDPWLKFVAEGLGTGLIAHFVFSTTDAIPLGAKVGILFWLILALSTRLFLHVSAAQPAAASPSHD